MTEEKLTGVRSPRRRPEEVSIPQKFHPFDMDHLQKQPLSGEKLFECDMLGDTQAEGSSDCQLCCPPQQAVEDVPPDSPPAVGRHGPWENPSQDRHAILTNMTQGFEDNFVEVWCRNGGEEGTDGTGGAGSRRGSASSPSAMAFRDLEKEFCFSADEDPVFRTVSGMLSWFTQKPHDVV